MSAGRVIEEGPTEAVISSPAHPYTRLLVSSADKPLHQQGVDAGTTVAREACPYLHPCEFAVARCAVMQASTDLDGEHTVRCRLF